MTDRFSRLRTVKRQFDPENMFRFNHTCLIARPAGVANESEPMLS